MKNKHVSAFLLATSFCAATMTACGVYGPPEEYTQYEEDISDSEVSDQGDDVNHEDSDYDPEEEEPACVYGPPEAFE
ncbi:MAG: hypothetical protein ACI4DO_06225 [Roseburia sp.]